MRFPSSCAACAQGAAETSSSSRSQYARGPPLPLPLHRPPSLAIQMCVRASLFQRGGRPAASGHPPPLSRGAAAWDRSRRRSLATSAGRRGSRRLVAERGEWAGDGGGRRAPCRRVGWSPRRGAASPPAARERRPLAWRPLAWRLVKCHGSLGVAASCVGGHWSNVTAAWEWRPLAVGGSEGIAAPPGAEPARSRTPSGGRAGRVGWSPRPKEESGRGSAPEGRGKSICGPGPPPLPVPLARKGRFGPPLPSFSAPSRPPLHAPPPLSLPPARRAPPGRARERGRRTSGDAGGESRRRDVPGTCR